MYILVRIMTRTLLLDAAGPSAAQYITLTPGTYEVSLLRWPEEGQERPSAFTTTSGQSGWRTNFYAIVHCRTHGWVAAGSFGNGVPHKNPEAAFEAFPQKARWEVKDDWDGPPAQLIIYLPAGRQWPIGSSSGKLHIEIRPISV